MPTLFFWLDRRIERATASSQKNLSICMPEFVVPDTGTYCALRSGHAAHFGDRLVVIRDEIHDEQREGIVKRSVLELQCLALLVFKVHMGGLRVLPCVGDEGF